jgi:predicted esterase
MDPHRGQPVATAGAPLGEGDVVAILLHGRNASSRDILTLVPALNRPAVTYLAPAAANHTWYPYSFLTETSKNEPDLSSGLAVLEALVSDLESRGIRKEQVVLVGFSQGACLAGEFSVRHAARYGGVIMFSGGLIGPPGTAWNYPGSFGRAPVFLGCSDIDAHIPKGRVDESAVVFERMEARVTKRLYAGMGHFINEDEVGQAQTILDDALRTGASLHR